MDGLIAAAEADTATADAAPGDAWSEPAAMLAEADEDAFDADELDDVLAAALDEELAAELAAEDDAADDDLAQDDLAQDDLAEDNSAEDDLADDLVQDDHDTRDMAVAVAPEPVADVAQAATEPGDEQVPETAPQIAATPAPAAATALDDDLDSILARLMSKTARRGDMAPETQPEPVAETAPVVEAPRQAADPAVPPLRARVMKMKRADFQAALARGQIPAQMVKAATAAAPAAAAELPDPAPAALPEPLPEPVSGALTPEEEADLARELAEVEADLMSSAGQGQIAYDALDDERTEAIYDDLDDGFDDDDAAEEAPASLFRDTAADATGQTRDAHDDLDDDLDDDPDGDPDGDDALDPARIGEAGQRLADADADRDVMRLMAKTISEMDEPESTHRRSAIAHLRAAVAATKAEKKEGGVLKPEPSADPYREDLASVVRPRRPVAEGGATTRRPGELRPAPLKLIAEQRVDLPRPAAAPAGATGAPVTIRPRRISVADLSAAPRAETAVAPAAMPRVEPPAGGFAEFAEQVGAQSLSEVLEAAASYLSFVEGQDAFSRPQLMTKVRMLGGDTFSLEDGLRSFGMLLRDGKIEKLKGGRFTVSDRIGFRPDTRAAG
jgi:hypothetical protein